MTPNTYNFTYPTDILLNPRRLKSFNRQRLKRLKDTPYVNGHNTIKIVRVADKYVRLSEHVFGIHQEHQRYNIENVFNYIHYRIAQIEASSNTEQEIIDVESQSLLYQTQYNNFIDLKDDLEDCIHEALEPLYESRKQIFSETPYSILYDTNNKSITIAFSNSFNVEITKDEKFDIFILTYNADLTTIQTHRDRTIIQHLNAIAELTHGNTHASTLFGLAFHKYFMFSANLRTLYVAPVDESYINIENDIKEYIQQAKLNNVKSYIYKLKPFNGFTRQFVVNKITRVRTVIYVVATNELTNESFIEYKEHITSIYHQIQDNATKIAKLIKLHE